MQESYTPTSHLTDSKVIRDVSPASHSTDLEEGEEEDESVIALWPSTSTEDTVTSDSVQATEPRRNPSRARKPPERWTYKLIRV